MHRATASQLLRRGGPLFRSAMAAFGKFDRQLRVDSSRPLPATSRRAPRPLRFVSWTPPAKDALVIPRLNRDLRSGLRPAANILRRRDVAANAHS